MAEYIEREALIRNIDWDSDLLKWSLRYGVEPCNIPSADVAPVVHGRWVREENIFDFDDRTFVCSVCNEPWVLIEGTPSENNMRYCPNCGAKMDLEVAYGEG